MQDRILKEPLFSKGVMEGFISDTKNGINGFGYDPIFIPVGKNETTASMSKDEKNVSHIEEVNR